MSSRKLIGSQRPANIYARSGVYVPDEMYSDKLENKNIIRGSSKLKVNDVYPEIQGNADPYINHVVMHIPGANYSTHMAKDYSSNNWDEYFFTSNVNPTSTQQELMTVEYGPRDNFSSFFNGDYYTVTDTASLRFGTSAFTIESWIKYSRTYTTAPGTTYVMGKGGNAGVTAGTGWTVFLSNIGRLGFFDAVGNTTVTSNTGLQFDVWTHFAIVRAGTGSNQTTIYINGVSDAVGTSTGNFTDTNNLLIGTDRTATASVWLGGYLCDTRIKTSAVYTSDFTPPTTWLDMTGAVCSISGTETSHPTIPAIQAQGLTITVSGGGLKRSEDTPFTVKYPRPTGSGYSSVKTTNRGWQIADYRNTAGNLQVGTTFTIEGWVYLTPSAAGDRVVLCGKGTLNEATVSGTGWNFGINGTTRYLGWADHANAVTAGNIAVPMGCWSHIAAVREGTGANQFKMYVNGRMCYSGTLSSTYGDTNSSFVILGSRNFQYHMRQCRTFGVRISANARYTNSFTINKSTFFDTVATVDANTKLYIFDAKSNRPLPPKTQYINDGYEPIPFRARGYGSYRIGGKGLFNTSGYSIQNITGGANSTVSAVTTNSSFSFGTGDFSIEFWYCNQYEWERISDATPRIFFDTRSAFDSSGIALEYEYRSLRLMSNGRAIISDQTAYFAQRAWVHVCVQRTSGYLALYINGRKTAEVYYPSTISSNNNKLYIMNGAYGVRNDRRPYGWMSDFRICKTQGAYSWGAQNPESFVVPTSQLTATANTVFLTANGPILQDNSSVGNQVWAGNKNDANYTSSWEVWISNFGPYRKPTEIANTMTADVWDSSSSGAYANVDTDTTSYQQNELMWIMRMTKSWTIEYWYFHIASDPGSITSPTHYYTSNSTNNDGWSFVANYTGSASSNFDMSFIWRSARFGSGVNEYIGTSGGTGNLKPHSWNHIAVVFDTTKATNVAMFVNGVRVATRTSFTPSYSHAYYDRLQSGGYYGVGDLRISDVARYDTTSGTCAVPTAVWTRDANTAVLLRMDSMFKNISNNSSWLHEGLPLPSYQYTKWGTGSMYFRNLEIAASGIGYDKLTISHYQAWGDRFFDTRFGDFTVEGWANWRAAANGGRAFPSSVACLFHYQNAIWVGINSTGYWQLLIRSTGTTSQTAVSYSTPIVSTGNNWDHWALVRQGGDYYLYINGTLCSMIYAGNHNTYAANGPAYSRHDDWYDVSANRLGTEYNDTPGCAWTGHVEDFRMTALARYQTSKVNGVDTMCHIGTNTPALPTVPFPRS